MEVDPLSAMTRFGIFFLIGGVTLIFVMWGVLKHFDKPRPVCARQTGADTGGHALGPAVPP